MRQKKLNGTSDIKFSVDTFGVSLSLGFENTGIDETN